MPPPSRHALFLYFLLPFILGYGTSTETQPPSNDCSVAGKWIVSGVTVSITNPTPSTVSFVSTDPSSTGWATSNGTLAPAPYGVLAQDVTLSGFWDAQGNLLTDMPAASGQFDGSCSVLGFRRSVPTDQLWCKAGTSCTVAPTPFNPTSPVAAFFSGNNTNTPGRVFLLEVDHSDIFWLGTANDMHIDAAAIALSLEIMRNVTGFKWQHECVLFVRAFVEIYPHLEAEMLHRLESSQLDIGGTFTEGFESTMANEVLVRQMYEGRRWFLDRYPTANQSVNVAFHQDGPLRALQMPQVYAKAGINFLKASRLSDNIFRWAAPDGSSLLAFEEFHYGYHSALAPPGRYDGKNTTSTGILAWMAEAYGRFKAGGFPPFMHATSGTDYAPPADLSVLVDEWNSGSGPVGDAFGDSDSAIPQLTYSHFNEYLSLLSASPGFNPPTYAGERPNLWWAETSATHHWMFSAWRAAGRQLPAADSWTTFRALVSGSWADHPTALLATAWLNITLNDHGLANEPTPYNMGCINDTATPMLCSLVRPDSPPRAQQIYALKWSNAQAAADAMVGDAQAWLAGQVDTAAVTVDQDAVVFMVFNSLAFERKDDPVEVTPPMGAPSYVVRDAAGTVLPSQLTVNNTVVFVPPLVPSMGYATFSISPAATNPSPTPAPAALPVVGKPWTAPYSTAFTRLTPGRGGLASAVDVKSGAELFDTTHYAAGEWMSLAYSANGASETRRYRHTATKGNGPTSGTPVFNSSMAFQRLGNASGWSGFVCTESGPIRVVFTSTPVTTAHSTVVLSIVAWNTIDRVDFKLSLLGWDNTFGVANRMVFPLAVGPGMVRNVTVAVPFGRTRIGVDELPGDMDEWQQFPGPTTPALERGWGMGPREVQDWVHAAGEHVGVGLSTSVGLFDWVDRTGAYGPHHTVLAPELLIHTVSNQGPFIDEAGDHHFGFSMRRTATPSDWRPLRTFGAGVQSPLSVAWPASSGAAATRLPPSASFLSVSHPNVMVTAVKRQHIPGQVFGDTESTAASRAAASTGVAVRLYEAEGQPTTTPVEVTLYVPAPMSANVTGAAATNLIEMNPVPLAHVSASDSSFMFRAASTSPWSIDTFLLTTTL